MTEIILRLHEVENRTGRKRSSIYQGVQENTFPAPVKIGPRAVGWLASEINAWIEARVQESRRSSGGRYA